MKIQDLLDKVLINQRLVLIDNSSSSYQAAVMMMKNRCGALLVCDSKTQDGSLVGIVTERDLAFRVIPKGLDPKTPVEKIMTKNVDTISPNKTTIDAIQVMKKGFRHLPVTKDKKIIGILSMRDLYDFANNQLQDSLKQHQEFMFGTGYGS